MVRTVVITYVSNKQPLENEYTRKNTDSVTKVLHSCVYTASFLLICLNIFNSRTPQQTLLTSYKLTNMV